MHGSKLSPSILIVLGLVACGGAEPPAPRGAPGFVRQPAREPAAKADDAGSADAAEREPAEPAEADRPPRPGEPEAHVIDPEAPAQPTPPAGPRVGIPSVEERKSAPSPESFTGPMPVPPPAAPEAKPGSPATE